MNKHRKLIIGLIALNLCTLVALILFVVVPYAYAASCFTDTEGHWAESYICWMFDNGLSAGFPDGTFRPADSVNRAQMAVFLQQLSGDGTAGPVVNAERLNGNYWYDFAPAGLGYERITDSMTVSPGAIGMITLTCPAGKGVLSGGGRWDSDIDAYLVASYSGADNWWSVKGFNDSGFGKTFYGYALCANLTP